MSQNAFSKLVPTPASFINAICRGQKKPSLEVMAALVRLGISGTWLLTGQGRPDGELPLGVMVLREEGEPAYKPGPPAGPPLAPELEAALTRLRRRPPSAQAQARLAAYLSGVLDAG